MRPSYRISLVRLLWLYAANIASTNDIEPRVPRSAVVIVGVGLLFLRVVLHAAVHVTCFPLSTFVAVRHTAIFTFIDWSIAGLLIHCRHFLRR